MNLNIFIDFIALLSKILKKMFETVEESSVKSLSRARRAEEKFHFHFPFPREKAISIRKSSPRNFLHRLGVK